MKTSTVIKLLLLVLPLAAITTTQAQETTKTIYEMRTDTAGTFKTWQQFSFTIDYAAYGLQMINIDEGVVAFVPQGLVDIDSSNNVLMLDEREGQGITGKKSPADMKNFAKSLAEDNEEAKTLVKKVVMDGVKGYAITVIYKVNKQRLYMYFVLLYGQRDYKMMIMATQPEVMDTFKAAIATFKLKK